MTPNAQVQLRAIPPSNHNSSCAPQAKRSKSVQPNNSITRARLLQLPLDGEGRSARENSARNNSLAPHRFRYRQFVNGGGSRSLRN